MADHKDVSVTLVGVENKAYDADGMDEHSFKENLSAPVISKSEPPNQGCYVTGKKACVIVLAAAVVAATVGLLVYYFHPDKVKSSDIETTSSLSASDSTTTPISPKDPPLPTDIRLPRNILPEAYDLYLRPDLYGNNPSDFTFTGHVTIKILVEKETDTITLHSKKLEITKDSIVVKDVGSNAEIKIAGTEYDQSREFYHINLDKNLEVSNTYSVLLHFKGKLSNDLIGIYYSTYTNGDGQIEYLMTSQLQATDARKVFPCLDEPDLKAKFTVSVERKRTHKSMSNTNIVETTNVDGSPDWQVDVYAESPIMSTYLLAFMVSKFECKSSRTRTGTSVEVCARQNVIDQVDYALEIAVPMQEYYEWYHDLEYPLPKTTHVAVPDFAAGAMENWGLILYRETSLLYDAKTTSASSKQWVTIVIAHELAHMWFGNLVTPQWWDDLWLNEGFATWLENTCTENVTSGKWQMEPQFVANDMQYVMRMDGLASSRPIYQPVNHPSEVDALFDSITYFKGASVIRMMQHFLGEEVFRWGLSKYLKSLEYLAASHDDLFSALTKEANKEDVNVTAIMYTWIRQMGYPVVKAVYNKNNGQLQLTQKHFLLDPSKEDEKPKSEFNYIWHVPITVMGKGTVSSLQSQSRVYWLTNKHGTLQNALTPDHDWILVNLKQQYYYRVNYEPEMWDSLIHQLNTDHKQIPFTENRAQIIDDSFKLGTAGEISQLIGLRTTEYLDKETEYVPWVAAVGNMDYLDSMLELTSSYSNLRTYMQQKTAGHLSRLGWNDQPDSDPHLDQRLRRVIISRSCYYGLDSCIRSASSSFSSWMADPDRNIPSANLQDYVYCNGIRYGGGTEWNFVFNKYKSSTDPNEQETFIGALACTRQADLLYGYMQKALDEEIRLQDFRYVIVKVSQNPNGRALAWNFLRANWRNIFEKFSGSTSTLASIIKGLTGSFSTELEMSELKAFRDTVGSTGSVEYAFNQAIETVNINLAWRKANEKEITNWLKEKTGGSPTVSPPNADIRLSGHVMPTNYRLSVRPDFYGQDPQAFSLNGTVVISVRVEKATDVITLHYKLLTIDESSVSVQRKGTSSSIQVVSTKYEPAKDFYHITVAKALQENTEYEISMRYSGPLTNDLAGIYTSSYIDAEGQKQYLVASQLQATDARKVFPCFDEPAIKATFTVTIERKDPFTSYCNTQLKETKALAKEWKADVYEETPLMSSYLLAFVVSQFQCKSTTSRGKQIDLCTRKELINQVDYAKSFAGEMQEFFEDYHNISFPLDKMAHVAVPDFASGAMENWGLILYREYALLYDPQSTDVRYKQYLTYVVAHELAHMWFGNLVTPTWWDDIWLNEGFASWMMTACTDHSFPEWKMEDQFVVTNLQRVMALDGLASSHPVYQPVDHPNSISQLFDTITYSKGATVIRMMKHFLGDDVFRWGLSKYLKERAYNASTHNDLFDHLTKTAAEYGKNINVTRVMYTWIFQMGYPLIHASYNSSTGKVSLKQKHFLLDPTKAKQVPSSPLNYIWDIPMTIVNNKDNAQNWDGQEPTWFTTQTGVTSTTSGAEWIMLNPGVTYYYRTNYDEEMWDVLINALNTNHEAIIKQQNRAQLIDDAFALGRASEIDQLVAMRVTEYLDKEMEYVPWLSATNNMDYIRKMMDLSPSYSDLKLYMQMKLEPIHRKLGWQENVEEDAHLEQRLRYTLMSQACLYGLPAAVSEATKSFALWMEDPIRNRVSPNLQEAVYCNGVRYGGSREWDFVFSRYKVAESAAQAATFIRAMGCAKDTDLLNSYLQKALNEEIRRGDFSAVIVAVAGNQNGRSIAWNFLRSQWDRIYEKYGSSTFAFTDIINGVTGIFSTAFELQELRNFKNGLTDFGTASYAFNQAIEKVAINIAWREKNEENIAAWLREKTDGSDPETLIDVRLPDTIKPVHYWVRIRPDIYTGNPKTFGFNGTSRVQLQIIKPTKTIILHSRSLDMNEKDWVLFDQNSTQMEIDRVMYDAVKEFFQIVSKVELQVGSAYFLEVNYTGPVDDSLLGIYWSSYKENDIDEFLLASQLQATHARKVFPCYDEPGIKSKFSITMEYMKARNYTTKGNTDIIQTEDMDNGWAADHYRETPYMSTYLLAFVISKFQCLLNTTRNGVDVEICARPGLIQQAQFANTFANNMQEYYVDYFNINYPLPRMTHTGLPDFAFGAMENWGLILYRESAVLYDPNSSSAANRQRVAIIIAHELAHQWFGNLVTPEWWDDLWLNEGFASWMEIKCTDNSFPDWKMESQMVVEDVQTVMKLDGLATSHPVYQTVNNPGEIDALFDTITYSKGASVNRMMNHFLGETVFRDGLSAYLRNRSYQAAYHDQLFETLTRTANIKGDPINVTRVMHTWIKQMGYPVVNVEYDSNTGQVTLTQKHFLLDPSKVDQRPSSPFGYIWEVPFTCVTSKDEDDVWTSPQITWFNTETDTSSCTANGNWIIANVGEWMYYRVNYTLENWDSLITVLNSNPEQIKDMANRAQIIDDAFNLGRSGDLDQIISLRVTEYLDKENNYVPWYSAIENLGYVRGMFQISSTYTYLKEYMQTKTQPHHDQLGWGDVSSGSHIDERMRQLIVREACSYGLSSCIGNATDLFTQWMNNVKNNLDNPILPDLRGVTYCTGVAQGGVEAWNFVFEQYPTAESANEANNFINALACTPSVNLLNDVMKRALQAEIRLQDFRTVIVAVSRNDNGRALAWNFFRANWDKIRSQFGDSPFILSQIVSMITESFSTEWELEELRNFKNSVPDAGSAVFAFEQAIESTSINIAWRKNNEDNISNWLQEKLS